MQKKDVHPTISNAATKTKENTERKPNFIWPPLKGADLSSVIGKKTSDLRKFTLTPVVQKVLASSKYK